MLMDYLGLNSPRNQNVVRDFIHQHSAGLVGLLETNVKVVAMGKLYQVTCNHRSFTSNSSFHKRGRVIMA